MFHEQFISDTLHDSEDSYVDGNTEKTWKLGRLNSFATKFANFSKLLYRNHCSKQQL